MSSLVLDWNFVDFSISLLVIGGISLEPCGKVDYATDLDCVHGVFSKFQKYLHVVLHLSFDNKFRTFTMG